MVSMRLKRSVACVDSRCLAIIGVRAEASAVVMLPQVATTRGKAGGETAGGNRC